jgi:hypothetical protein
MKFLIDAQLHDLSLTSYARQDLKQFIHSIFRKAIGPILISRETGAVHHCGTSAPLDERIKQQEHRLLADLKLT